MTRLTLTYGTGWCALLGALAIAAIVAGCAGTTQGSQVDERQLTAAGFKVLVATTPQQKEHLQNLPAGKFTQMQRTGSHFYLYPDAANNRVYVGTPREYAAYQGPKPGVDLAAQRNADMASYNKQDVAVAKDTTKDLNDPYYFWPSFFDLGWQQ